MYYLYYKLRSIKEEIIDVISVYYNVVILIEYRQSILTIINNVFIFKSIYILATP